jgi:predicted nuclease of predicted toxin-antitoxin system
VPKRPTFYVDCCLGKAVAEALRAAGATVELHRDNFAPDVEDTIWIPRVAAKGWVILTKDKNIRRRHGERETTLLSRSRMFTLSSGNMRGAVMAELFVRHLAVMEALALALVPPFLAIVSQEGIEIVYPRVETDPSSVEDNLPGDST